MCLGLTISKTHMDDRVKNGSVLLHRSPSGPPPGTAHAMMPGTGGVRLCLTRLLQGRRPGGYEVRRRPARGGPASCRSPGRPYLRRGRRWRRRGEELVTCHGHQRPYRDGSHECGRGGQEEVGENKFAGRVAGAGPVQSGGRHRRPGEGESPEARCEPQAEKQGGAAVPGRGSSAGSSRRAQPRAGRYGRG